MYGNFDEMMNAIRKNAGKKIVAVAAAHDHEVLECAAKAKKEQLADFILIGRTEKIKEILLSLGEAPDTWEMIEEANDAKAAEKAVALASEDFCIPRYSCGPCSAKNTVWYRQNRW